MNEESSENLIYAKDPSLFPQARLQAFYGENVLACRSVVLSGCRISNMFCVRGIVTDVGVR